MATMKLRVRSASGGPTVRVQAPLLCSLQGLKEILAPLISLPVSSFSLSLNKKDVIQGPGAALLSSLGVTNGDLVFYISGPGIGSGLEFQNPLGNPGRQQGGVVGESSSGQGNSREVRARVAGGGRASSSGPIGGPEPASRSARAVSTPNTRRELCAAAAARRAATLAPESQGLPPSTGTSSPSIAEEGGAMEVETDGEGAEISRGGHRLVPIPDLLQRVLASEVCNVRDASAYLVLSVHAVMLETGFVRVDTANSSRAALDGYELPSGWNSVGLVNLTYTLPEFATSSNELSSGRATREEALLRCQVVGNVVVVYGAVTGGSVYRLSLSVSKFLRENLKIRKFMGESSSRQNEAGVRTSNPTSTEEVAGGEFAESSAAAARGASIPEYDENVFRDIFELWKEVKDSLSLPLLTIMCEKAGLPPPPSLLRLPTELKIKVLDSLPSLALGNISCACSELRFLASSEDLWKERYKEEYGVVNLDKAPYGRGWKHSFVREFEERKRRAEERRETGRRFRSEVFAPGIILRPFSPQFGVDYFQGIGGGQPRGGGFGGGPYGGDVGGGGGFRSHGFRGPSGRNHHPAAAFPSIGSGLDNGRALPYGYEDGANFPNLDFDGQGVRQWPPGNGVMSRIGRPLGGLPSVEYPRRLDRGEGGRSDVLFPAMGRRS